MTTLTASSSSSDLRGAQRPRIECVPRFASSVGEQVIELGSIAGIELDDWQQHQVMQAFGRRSDGKWAAFEVAWVLPRQNGKNGILEVVQLGKLFVVEERLQVHTAHLADTANEAFVRLADLIADTPLLSKRVLAVHRANGKEGITLRSGCRIKFKTRTAGGGRGLTGDSVYGDEAYNFPRSTHGALFPTMSARSITGNPQMFYTSSAVDQESPGHEHGFVLAGLRERGLSAAGSRDAATAERLLYGEWSVDEDAIRANPALIDDPASWAQANPALGIRISAEHVATERRAMDDRTFMTERLGVGDWPSTVAAEQIFDPADLAACLDVDSAPVGALHFTFDADLDGRFASIAVAGTNAEGLPHIECVESREGLDWLADRIPELIEKHGAASVTCDAKSPAAHKIPALAAKGIEVATTNADEQAKACGLLLNAVRGRTVRWSDAAGLVSAMRGASKRPLGDTWAWSRKASNVDISPLVACTLALWAASQHKVEMVPWGSVG